MTLGQEFDPRNNALNAWRLALATGVILWHSILNTGHGIGFEPAHQFVRDAWVDGFFAISGFLIASSWFKNPRLREFAVARALRILPALWACLIVTAFVLAPIGVALSGGSVPNLLMSFAPIEYVVKNSAVAMVQTDIAGTPLGIPWPHMWNGSLWTLLWEVFCYVAIAVLGLVGLLRRRWFIPILLVLALFWSSQLPSLTWFGARPPSAGEVDVATIVLYTQATAARFAAMFAAGVLLFQFRDRIPARWSLVAVSTVIVMAATFMPNYRVIGAVPLAYAIIVSGALLRSKSLRLRTDLSYGTYIYAYPIQQVLITAGLLNPPMLFAVAVLVTLPVAALSWFLVEKPALALRARFRRRDATVDADRHPAGEAEGELNPSQ